MWKKTFGEGTEEASCMKVTLGKCVQLHISADFSRTPSVTEQNTSISNPWQRQRSYHLSTRFLPNKENIAPLFISLLHSQNNV